MSPPVMLPPKVTIREVGPREGFQILPHVVPTDRKIQLIEALVAAGLTQIEVTSLVRADRVPQMADATQLIAALPEAEGVRFTALYLNERGFERGEELAAQGARVSNGGWLYTSPSNAFLHANAGTSVEQSIAGVPEWLRLFRAHNKTLEGVMVSTAFGCALEGAISPTHVVELVERFVKACNQHGERLPEVCLADTVGLGNPKSVRECVKRVQELGVTVSLHLHDTWGLGLSNVYAGILEGVTIFESSVGGLGGCPFTPGASGNVATEDIVYLCHAMGVSTGVDIEKCCLAAELAEELVGAPLAGRVYQSRRRVGSPHHRS